MTALEEDVAPAGAFRMPPGGRDGTLRKRNGALVRLLHHGEEPVHVRAWITGKAVRFRAEARHEAAAAYGIDRMRFALGVDTDLAPFHRQFKGDPLLGPVIRRKPWLRPRRRPEPFEALAWAICEQLIEGGRAAAIERRLVHRYGRRSACEDLRDAPTAAALAARSPAEMEACGLSGRRSVAMVRAAREVASGRADLSHHEPTWRRLRAIPCVGAWTLEMLALHGQGRDDQLPAGDLAYIKAVGVLAGLGRRATEDEVREFFAPYAPFRGLAGTYALHRVARLAA